MITNFKLHRHWLTSKSTIGTLDVFGHTVFTLEDTQRPHKVAGETRIPAGEFKLELRNVGRMNGRYINRFGDMHKGMIWLRAVPDFEWIYIHPLNTPGETLGCIGVGMTHGKDYIGKSVTAYKLVYPMIVEAINLGECYITIHDEN